MAAIGGPWLPADWPDRIRALAGGQLTPVTPRRAATVMLVRDGVRGGLEVFLLRRRASMPFAAGMYAYPGGAVDPGDTADLRESAEPPDGVAPVDPVGAGFVAAAVRETFEESGVLLAGPSPDTLVAGTTGPGWEADRAALVARELTLAGLLARRGLVPRADLLGAWARWITPEFEPRRYDTIFFLAALPAGQRARDVSGEADHVAWLRPADALAACERGELLMMPPTLATLRELTPFRTAAQALAASAGRDLRPVMARVRPVGDEVVVSWPGYDAFERRVALRVPGTAADDSQEPER
jgi:8-oxo-dGTP pyrophosphatase MutT (NUDIX family)